MKKILLLIVLLAGMSSFSQKNEKFKSGVKIIEKEKIKEYKKPKSILFIFKGHTHSIHYFLDLKKRIRKDFKKRMKKEFKHFKLNFNYDLNAEKPFKFDLKKIPSKKYNKNEYESICYISLSDLKGWDNELIEKRKQNYNLNIELKTTNLDSLITLKLNVNTYYTIVTENRNSSKLIYKTIMEN